MNKLIRNTLILTAITVVAGACLGLVYDVTKEPIARTAALAKQNAYRAVFTEAASFTEGDISHVSNADIILAGAGYEQVRIDEALEAHDASDAMIGYVFTVTDTEGYGGDITLAMGVKSDGTLNGIEILNISETAGLGMNANTDAFKNQFRDKKVAQFSSTKTGAASEYEIDALSGATITTNAMVDAVNGGLIYFRNFTGGGDHE